MNVVSRIMVPAFLWFTLLICGGCGATLNSSHYVYNPGEKINADLKPLPVSVSINYLEDLRKTESYAYTPLIFIPLMPYGHSHYDRPETDYKFAVKGLNPSVDFANALMQEMKQNNLFREVSLIHPGDNNKADLIVTGRISRASVDTKVTSYGISMFGMLTWILGLPEGKVYNELDIKYEMRRTYDNVVVWKCDVKSDWGRVFGFYYN
jgi:hypothetical protein